MSWLLNQKTPVNIAVFGASGGIAQGVISYLLQHLEQVNLHCISRKHTYQEHKLTTQQSLTTHHIEHYDDAALDLLTNRLNNTKFDLVFIATGTLHDSTVQPEKRVKNVTQHSFEKIMNTNALVPIMIAKHMLSSMGKKAPAAICALGARVGSISDNKLGGWYSYRASKAALVMMLKTLAIETQRTHPDLRVCAIHPGTVNTDLSQPFQSNVEPHKLFSKALAGQHIVNVINSLNMSHNGQQLAWDGSVVPY